MLSSTCIGGHTALAFYLLGQGADPNAGGWFRLSALDYVLAVGQPEELVKALMNVEAETDQGFTREQAAEKEVEHMRALTE